MKKFQVILGGFFALLSSLNLIGVLKVGVLYEPIPPHLREENVQANNK
ncbi:hypothetical protein J2X83_004209 [Brevibacillus nitrificans]|nr:hypothetical protein [Brevibacillus nitrificans]